MTHPVPSPSRALCSIRALGGAEEEEHAAREEKDVREESVDELQVRVSSVSRSDVAPAQQARVQLRSDHKLRDGSPARATAPQPCGRPSAVEHLCARQSNTGRSLSTLKVGHG